VLVGAQVVYGHHLCIKSPLSVRGSASHDLRRWRSIEAVMAAGPGEAVLYEQSVKLTHEETGYVFPVEVIHSA
jgi:hypothetical protein